MPKLKKDKTQIPVMASTRSRLNRFRAESKLRSLDSAIVKLLDGVVDVSNRTSDTEER